MNESATGVHVPPILKPPFRLPPHPIPLGCRRALALHALFHELGLVIYFTYANIHVSKDTAIW